MPRKRFLSKYMYDEQGSRLFDLITQQDEYYLTNAELEIMRDHAAAMADQIGPAVTLIEFGSGSSQKTRSLLQHLRDPAAYVPVDISIQQLHKSAAKLATRYPDIEVLPVCADFTRRFAVPEGSRQPWRRVVYFPGSTIGNFSPRGSLRLLGKIARTCGLGGAVLIGVDLKKDAETIEAAYNDAHGATAAFNLNLLARVNRELGGDFNLRRFKFQANYNGRKGRVESWLISLAEQVVNIGDEQIHFRRGERIHTEYSHKFTVDEFREFAAQVGFELVRVWTDEREQFAVLCFHVAENVRKR